MNPTTYKEQFNKYARPMIIRSVFSGLMYTADKLIAALFIGAVALVATTLISPLMFLVAALSSFFISGLGAYVGLLVGRDNIGKANRLSSGILILMTLIGAMMTLPSFFFTEEIAHLLGARGNFLTLSVNYLKIFSLSFPLLLVGKGLDVLILNDGSPKYSFVLNMIVSVSNLLLNIFAVAVLGWGIKGLAAATVLSSGIQLIGGLWSSIVSCTHSFCKVYSIVVYKRYGNHTDWPVLLPNIGCSDILFKLPIADQFFLYSH